MPADAGGEVGRTNAVARLSREELLDDAVLERVEGDDGDPPARPKDPERGVERCPEIGELIVHRDPERLKNTRRGIGASGPARLHPRDKAAELVSRREGGLRATADDRARDARGLRFLAVLGEHAAEV